MFAFCVAFLLVLCYNNRVRFSLQALPNGERLPLSLYGGISYNFWRTAKQSASLRYIRKEGKPMTILDFISVMGYTFSVFQLGFWFGSYRKKK